MEQPLHILYRNWRGEVSVRSVSPRSTYFGVTQWHPEPQWFLLALDEEKGATRDFAMADILSLHRTLDDAQLALSLAPQSIDNEPISVNDEFILPEGIRIKIESRVGDYPLRTLSGTTPPITPTFILLEMTGPTPGATWTVSETFLRQRCVRVASLWCVDVA